MGNDERKKREASFIVTLAPEDIQTLLSTSEYGVLLHSLTHYNETVRREDLWREVVIIKYRMGLVIRNLNYCMA